MILPLRLFSTGFVTRALLIVIALGTSVAFAEDEPPQSKSLEFPAVIPKGEAGDHVWEIQTTLNARLRLKTVSLPEGYAVDSDKDGDGKGTRELKTNDHRDVRIRGDWEPAARNDGESGDTENSLKLPDEPLHPAGIYGEQTYALVMMFQIQNNLQPTGELDAVTLGLLEPIIPASPLLRPIMRRVESALKDRSGQDDYAWYVKQYTAIVATLLMAVAALIAYLAAYIFFRLATRPVVSRIVSKIVSKPAQLVARLFPASGSPWFAALREEHFFARLAHFAPALLICFAAGIFPVHEGSSIDKAYSYINTFEQWNTYVWRAGLAYLALAFTLVGLAYVNACEDVFRQLQAGEGADENSETSMSGIAVFAWRTVATAGVVLICAALLGRSPMYLVGGLGVFTAVIMLVFRDSLLGFVASVQIVVHKLIEVGDWIEMPKYLADGVVMDIALSTIKVKNFDNTITSIPTHVVLSDSFRNYRNMHQVGGRRIKRAINIDLRSIKVCTPEMIEAYKSFNLISDYVRKKETELREWAKSESVAPGSINSRRLTNISAFRAYVESYLASREELHPAEAMTCLVRELEPTEKGLPIEIYAFCRETSLAKFEAIQADIIDHVLSVLPDFDLRPFQEISEIPK